MTKTSTPSTESAIKPIDRTSEHAWIVPSPKRGVLTEDGLEFIANHQYRAGTYTWLDNALNPFWNRLTELLPLWLAPNMVTTIGGLHCLSSYLLTWYYSPNLDTAVPSWVIIVNAYCAIAYYTLDCMDGKQARRTNSSSPLGQLFDHGLDCLCNLSHLSAISAFTMMGGTWSLVLAQASLQFSFFMAQWEEYYTHVLPHATGNIGVTEVNYGLGLFSLCNAFVDREAIWKARVGEKLQIIHVLLIGWCGMMSILIILSLIRVFQKVQNLRLFGSAIAKLISPFALAVAPFLLPHNVVQYHGRCVSLAVGFCFSILTIKMIVLSMAKAAYGSFQPDVVPLFAACLWLRVNGGTSGGLVLNMLSIFYGLRLLWWTSHAIHQICNKLDIYCFSIKRKKE